MPIRRKPNRFLHPWDRYFSNKRGFKLKRGVHYSCQDYVMAQQIRNAAYRRNKRVSVDIGDGVIKVTLREAA